MPTAGTSSQQEQAGMSESELRELLTSIAHLAEHGEIPIHVFGTLISSARGKLAAELLHQRWLADGNFARIVAQLVLQLHGTENKNLATLSSEVLALVLRDYRSRRKLRKQSRQIDRCLSACLIEPLFRCLLMLAEETPDDADLRTVAQILIGAGPTLNQLNPMAAERLVLKCRQWLVTSRLALKEETKRLLLTANDLWTYAWDWQRFPDCLRRHYEDYYAGVEQAQKQKEAKEDAAKMGGGAATGTAGDDAKYYQKNTMSPAAARRAAKAKSEPIHTHTQKGSSRSPIVDSAEEEGGEEEQVENETTV